jgi:23S rRNA G2445 N2-methylase RlmL
MSNEQKLNRTQNGENLMITVSKDSTAAFSRRIKTHITGPEHRFAITTPRELAPLCLGEAGLLDIPALELTEAGVEFTGRLKDAYVCNLWLRTAGRVLCRLSSFRAGAVEELFSKASRIPWELWLNPQVPIGLEAGVEYSRISNEGKVVEVLAQGIGARLGKIAAFHLPQSPEAADYGGAGEKKLLQKILVRLVENHCEISLDTSGPHLYQRGYRLGHSTAPIRETLAAAILLKAGWKPELPLVDGMCGSGVFAIEAALMSRHIAPGIGRDFLLPGKKLGISTPKGHGVFAGKSGPTYRWNRHLFGGHRPFEAKWQPRRSQLRC